MLLAELLREWRAEGLSEDGTAAAADAAGTAHGGDDRRANGAGGAHGGGGAGSDMSSCVGLLEQPAIGLFALMDTQSALAAGTDESMLRELAAGPLSRHSKLRLPSGAGSGFDFAVQHYAGEVKYSAAGLVAKNRDPVPEHIAALFRASNNALLASLFAAEPPRRGAHAAARHLARRSVSAKFRRSLSELMSMVASTTSHFIRCIKPNAAGVPRVFDKALVVHQLRCAGVLEIARIYSAGFPVRLPFADLVLAYGAIHPPARALARSHPAEAAVLLLVRARVNPELYRLGRTKIFARRALADALDSAAHAAAHAATTQLQAAVRSLVARRKGERANAAVVLQAAARRAHARQAVSTLHTVQAAKAYKEPSAAAQLVQAHLRGHRERQRATERAAERRRALDLQNAKATDAAAAARAGGDAALIASAEATTPRPGDDDPHPSARRGYGAHGRATQLAPSVRTQLAIHSGITQILEARIAENMRQFDTTLGQPGAAVGSAAPNGGSGAPAGPASAVAAASCGGTEGARGEAGREVAGGGVPLTRVERALSWGRKPPGGAVAGLGAPSSASGAAVGAPPSAAANPSSTGAAAAGSGPPPASALDAGWVHKQLDERAAEAQRAGGADGAAGKRARPGRFAQRRRPPAGKRAKAPAGEASSGTVHEVAVAPPGAPKARTGDEWVRRALAHARALGRAGDR